MYMASEDVYSHTFPVFFFFVEHVHINKLVWINMKGSRGSLSELFL